MSNVCLKWLFTVFLLASLSPVVTLRAAEKPYEETEKKHSFFSFVKPAEKTADAEFDRAERLRTAGRFNAASKSYRALVLTWPRSEKAAIAQQRYAEMLEQRGELEDAFDEYTKLIEKYTGSFDYPAIIERQFAIAKSVMEKRRGRWLLLGGFKAPERAIPLFESILKHAPRWEHAPEAQYLIGSAHEIQDELELAIVAYMNTQHRYPASAFAEKAALSRARCLVLLTEESPNDEELLEQAYAAAVVFLNAYPDAQQRDVAQGYKESLLRRRATVAYERGIFYDRVAKQPRAALRTYETFVKMYPDSEWTQAARDRIQYLRPLAEKAGTKNET